MKIFFLIATLTFCYALPVLSQYPSFSQSDSLKIENLKKNLPGLKDRERVDALNQLSGLYASFYRIGTVLPKKESIPYIYSYAKEANDEAAKIDYPYGIARSLVQLSSVIPGATSPANRLQDTTVKKYLQQAITMGRGLLNDDHIANGRMTTEPEFEIAKSLVALSESIDNLIPNRQQKDTVTKKYLQRAITIGEKLHKDSVIGAAYYWLGRLEEEELNYQKAIFHFHKAGELQQETLVTWQLCAFYTFKGRYEDGFPHCEKCTQLAQANAIKDSSHWGDELVQMSDYYMALLYQAAGDFETAMDYLLKANNYAIKKNLPWKMYLSISEFYCKLGNPDSALSYWNLWNSHESPETHQRFQEYANSIRAQIYIKNNQPDSALPLFERSIKDFNKKWDKDATGALIGPLMLRAEVYKQKKNYKNALGDAREAVEYAEQGNYRQSMMDGYQLLSLLYYQLGQNKNAYETLVKYLTIKDSIQTRQFLLRLNNYKRQAEDAKKESRIGFLNRDNQIKQQQLRQEATFRNFLIAAFIAIVFAGLYVFRNLNLKRRNEKLLQEQKEQGWKLKQLENENKHVELQRQAAELEMQALRSQMNPHFIFNCLSSINRIIMKNDCPAASDYLTRFSRLMRMVLINSQRSMIPLEDELQMLRLYLDMERLRFKDSFTYSVIFTNTIDEGAVMIPPLLLQPFCENAIWHGLMQKDSPGLLTIELSMQDNILNCLITDNGIGREKAKERKSKTAEREKSMGLKITTERLALLNREKGLHTSYEIDDLKDEDGNAAGTRVTLKIGLKETVENMA